VFVGRGGELAQLHQAYRRVVDSSRPLLVSVVGDAGVGKTRLVREFWAWLGGQPERPLLRSGRCLSYGHGITYWPLGEVLKEHFGIRDSDSVSASSKTKLRGMGSLIQKGPTVKYSLERSEVARRQRRAGALAFGISRSRCRTCTRFRDVVAIAGGRRRQVCRNIERFDVARRFVIDFLAFDQAARATSKSKHHRHDGGGKLP